MCDKSVEKRDMLWPRSAFWLRPNRNGKRARTKCIQTGADKGRSGLGFLVSTNVKLRFSNAQNPPSLPGGHVALGLQDAPVQGLVLGPAGHFEGNNVTSADGEASASEWATC